MLSLAQLETHLWQAAQLLRGSVDSGDFKRYILALLFYKRLCDVWDHSHGSSRAAFEIPQGQHWSDLRARPAALGAGLSEVFASVQARNPGLAGVFRGIEFGDAQRFPDALVASLLEHFELHRLDHANVEQDVLGRAYEYLIARFADDAGKKGGEFYTPSTVATLMAKCLALAPGMEVYDPTCGSGGLLLQVIRHMQERGHGGNAARLYGQEKNLNTWAICKMNMILHNLVDADIRLGDTLQAPAHLSLTEPFQLQRFDRVIANPPFSLKAWGAPLWRPKDPYRRDRYGCPPGGAADFAFVQHMLASLKPDGLMAVVLPCGILFREKAEGKIRTKLVQQDKIETVIALPRNLFYGTEIPTCVLLAREHKPMERKQKIQMIDATSLAVSVGRKDELCPAGIERVVELYQDWSREDELSKVVTSQEVAGQGYNLTVQRYVQQRPSSSEGSPLADLQELMQAHKERDRAEALLFEELSRLGYR